jgi:hypothetical protein
MSKFIVCSSCGCSYFWTESHKCEPKKKQEEEKMTPRDFCYWLQGAIEVNPYGTASLNEQQVEVIKKNLELVFKHEIKPPLIAPQLPTKDLFFARRPQEGK